MSGGMNKLLTQWDSWTSVLFYSQSRSCFEVLHGTEYMPLKAKSLNLSRWNLTLLISMHFDTNSLSFNLLQTYERKDMVSSVKHKETYVTGPSELLIYIETIVHENISPALLPSHAFPSPLEPSFFLILTWNPWAHLL